MNCYFCQKSCEFMDQKNTWKILTCRNHPNQVDHIFNDNNVLELVELPFKHHNKNYIISYDPGAHSWELNEVYGEFWNSPYSTLKKFESDFNISPDNLQDKLKFILTFL